jgi:hypothetical protein
MDVPSIFFFEAITHGHGFHDQKSWD